MAYTEFYTDPAASDNTGSGSTTGAVVHSYTSAVLAGGWNSATGVFTVASGNPSGDGVAVGDWASVYVTANGVTAFVGRVTARDTTTITVSTTIKGGTAPATDALGATTLKIGGAWKGPNGTDWAPITLFSGAMVNASSDIPRMNVKEDTYAVTGGGTNANAGPFVIEGYTTVEGDGGLPLITGDVDTLPFIMLTFSAAVPTLKNLSFARNGLDTVTNTDGDQLVYCTGTCVSPYIYRCRFKNSWRDGLRLSGVGYLCEECEFDACNVDAGNAFAPLRVTTYGRVIRPFVHHTHKVGDEGDCLGMIIGSAVNEPVTVLDGIFTDNDGSGLQVASNNFNVLIKNCTMARNGRSGITFQSSSTNGTSLALIENCLLEGNANYGIRNNATAWAPVVRTCAFYNNTTAATTGLNASLVTGSVTLTGDPFIDATNGNFGLSTAVGGAACRHEGVGGHLSGATYSDATLSYPSIGAAEPDTEAGGSVTMGGAGTVTFG